MQTADSISPLYRGVSVLAPWSNGRAQFRAIQARPPSRAHQLSNWATNPFTQAY
jgi:hypothetical protein